MYLGENLSFYYNTFIQNVASQNGFAIYINASLKFIQLNNNEFCINSFVNQNQSSGSVLYLANPKNISIIDNFFKDNLGIFGTCIYYSETSNIFELDMNNF